MNKTTRNFFRGKRIIFLLLLPVSILIAAGGYLYYSAEESFIRNSRYRELESAAHLRVNTVAEWYNDKIDDARYISHDFLLLESIDSYLENPSGTPAEKLKSHLRSLAGQHSYSNIYLLSDSGSLLAAADTAYFLWVSHNLNFASSSIDSVLFIDIHKENIWEDNLIEIIVPVSGLNKDRQVFLQFRISAEEHFFPLFERKPVSARSSEIFLMRLEEDHFRAISWLRFKDNSRLDTKISYNKENFGVKGYSGIYEGAGYSGEGVLASVFKIPGTPWHLAVQVNQSDVYADIKYKAFVTIAFAVGLIIIFGTGLSAFYNHRQKNIYFDLYNKEKELWHSRQRFKLTLDSIGEGVITTDIDGNIEYMNHLAEEMTGWQLKEAQGKNLDEVYSIKNEITDKKENRVIDKVLKYGIIKELANHTVLISRYGKEIPVMDTGAPVHDSEEKVTGIVLVFEDETEKRRQQELIIQSEARLRNTLDNMLEGCQIISRDWKYIYVNDAVTKQGKTTKEALLGKKMMDVYPGIEFTRLFVVLISCMNDKRNEVMESEFTFPDGSKGWFELSIQYTDEGLFILSQDITARKLYEKELIKAKETAEEMSRVKSNFLSNMSHEMRTPLVAILGFADLLKEHLNEKYELLEMTEYIKKGGERLLETVNQILNFSAIESGTTELNLRAMNIIPILKELGSMYSHEVFTKEIVYRFVTDSDSVTCSIDKDLFRNIISNLLSNAFKYTEHGSITLKVGSDNKKARIWIIDTGIGIPEAKQNLIWEEFRQVSEGLNRRYQGAGLGLTIAKKYIALSGGIISLESKEGKGTIISIELPVVKDEQSKVSGNRETSGSRFSS